MAYRFIAIGVHMARDYNFVSKINVPFVAISVVSPEHEDYEVAYNPLCKDILYLRFHDVIEGGQVNSLQEVGNIITHFNDDQAREIIEYALNHKEIKNFMINCEAGMSRSAGIAFALSEILNEDTENPEQYVDTIYNKSYHNQSVKKKILDIYYKEYNKEKANA
jgi:predicted protein tyrosine phosphatase